MTYEQCQNFCTALSPAIEDQHFEQQRGIDFPRISARDSKTSFSASHYRRSQHIISMQCRKSFPDPQRPQLPPQNAGKFVEFARTIEEIEAALHEAANFPMYANQVYLAHGITDLPPPRNFYFGPNRYDLKLQEPRFSRGMVKPRNFRRSRIRKPPLRRRNLVIHRMERKGKITPGGRRERMPGNRRWPALSSIRERPRAISSQRFASICVTYGTEAVQERGLRVFFLQHTEHNEQRVANQSLRDGPAKATKRAPRLERQSSQNPARQSRQARKLRKTTTGAATRWRKGSLCNGTRSVRD